MNQDAIDNFNYCTNCQEIKSKGPNKGNDKVTIMKASAACKWLFVQLLKS